MEYSVSVLSPVAIGSRFISYMLRRSTYMTFQNLSNLFQVLTCVLSSFSVGIMEQIHMSSPLFPSDLPFHLVPQLHVKVLKTYMYLVLSNDSQTPKKINISVEFNRNTYQIKASEIIGLLAAKTENRQCRLSVQFLGKTKTGCSLCEWKKWLRRGFAVSLSLSLTISLCLCLSVCLSHTHTHNTHGGRVRSLEWQKSWDSLNK